MEEFHNNENLSVESRKKDQSRRGMLRKSRILSRDRQVGCHGLLLLHETPNDAHGRARSGRPPFQLTRCSDLQIVAISSKNSMSEQEVTEPEGRPQEQFRISSPPSAASGSVRPSMWLYRNTLSYREAIPYRQERFRRFAGSVGDDQADKMNSVRRRSAAHEVRQQSAGPEQGKACGSRTGDIVPSPWTVSPVVMSGDSVRRRSALALLLKISNRAPGCGYSLQRKRGQTARAWPRYQTGATRQLRTRVSTGSSLSRSRLPAGWSSQKLSCWCKARTGGRHYPKHRERASRRPRRYRLPRCRSRAKASR